MFIVCTAALVTFIVLYKKDVIVKWIDELLG